MISNFLSALNDNNFKLDGTFGEGDVARFDPCALVYFVEDGVTDGAFIDAKKKGDGVLWAERRSAANGNLVARKIEKGHDLDAMAGLGLAGLGFELSQEFSVQRLIRRLLGSSGAHVLWPWIVVVVVAVLRLRGRGLSRADDDVWGVYGDFCPAPSGKPHEAGQSKTPVARRAGAVRACLDGTRRLVL